MKSGQTLNFLSGNSPHWAQYKKRRIKNIIKFELLSFRLLMDTDFPSGEAYPLISETSVIPDNRRNLIGIPPIENQALTPIL